MGDTASSNSKIAQLREKFRSLAQGLTGGTVTTDVEPEDVEQSEAVDPVPDEAIEAEAEVDAAEEGSDDTSETVEEIIEEMHGEYQFQTSLSMDELVTVVEAFFEGVGDVEIARRLGDESRDQTVARARRHLHLMRESDFDNPPFDPLEMEEMLNNDAEYSQSEMADRLGCGRSTVSKYLTVFEKKQEAESEDYDERLRQAVEEQ